MNVVIVGAALPYPANSGGRIRTSSLMVRLARRHRLTYVGARNPDRAEAALAREYLNDHGIETIEIEHAVAPKVGMRFYARLAANLASPLPYSVASHHDRAVTSAVRRLAVQRRVDLWQAEWAAGVEAFRGLAGARKLVMVPNVETLIWERYAQTEPHPLKRLYIHEQCRKFERFERRAFAAADRVVTVSRDDDALVRERFGMPRVDVVRNGIDRAYFEAVRPDRDPRRILFLGSLEWRPNLDALGLMLDRIFPLVRAGEPLAQLDIVGRNPPAALAKRVAASENVALHANVGDVRPFLARSGVMAVPLRIGGGSRLKILEALAAGLPVVSTAIGAEGLELRAGEEFLSADEAPECFASELLRCLRDPATVQAMAARGCAMVLARYDWDALADELERSRERCLVA